MVDLRDYTSKDTERWMTILPHGTYERMRMSDL